MNFNIECLLNVIEYCELMEQSSLESKLEEVITLFINFMKLPLEEVKIRIIRKMVSLNSKQLSIMFVYRLLDFNFVKNY